MASWAHKRKYSILFILFLIVAIPISYIVYAQTHKPASCNDKIKNQDELGVDCGGACKLLCKEETSELIISWNRILKVDEGIYTAVAYIENPNVTAGAKDVPYIFRVYGEQGVVIDERMGVTDLYPKNAFAIVEPGILTGERTVQRMTFEFTKAPVWKRQAPITLPLIVENEIITREDGSPRIDAVLRNTSVETQRDITVVAIAYAGNGNALGASKTIVERLLKGESKKLVFTWPYPFASKVSRIEIVPSL